MKRARKLKALILKRLGSRNKCRLLRQASPKQKACLEGCLLELHPSFVLQVILRRPKALDRNRCHTIFDVSNHNQAIRQMQVGSATLLSAQKVRATASNRGQPKRPTNHQ